MWHWQTVGGLTPWSTHTCPAGQVPPLNPQTILPSAPREFTNRGIVVLKLFCTCSIQKLVHTPCDYCKCNPVITCVCCPYKMVLVIESLETAWPQIYYSMMNGWFIVSTWWQLNNCLSEAWWPIGRVWKELEDRMMIVWLVDGERGGSNGGYEQMKECDHKVIWRWWQGFRTCACPTAKQGSCTSWSLNQLHIGRWVFFEHGHIKEINAHRL